MSKAVPTRSEVGRAGLRMDYDSREPDRDISRIDLESYLRRIGYTGALNPSAEGTADVHQPNPRMSHAA